MFGGGIPLSVFFLLKTDSIANVLNSSKNYFTFNNRNTTCVVFPV